MNPKRPWLNQYPEGVPHDIELARYASLVEMLEESFKKHPQHTAIESMGQSISYQSLDRLSKYFASYLQTLNLEPGSRVAIMFPNVAQYVVAIKVSFDRDALPLPLRPLAYINPQWYLSSEWTLWPLKK